jgi:hypothetical protein
MAGCSRAHVRREPALRGEPLLPWGLADAADVGACPNVTVAARDESGAQISGMYRIANEGTSMLV